MPIKYSQTQQMPIERDDDEQYNQAVILGLEDLKPLSRYDISLLHTLIYLMAISSMAIFFLAWICIFQAWESA